jgi:hypothetical protein
MFVVDMWISSLRFCTRVSLTGDASSAPAVESRGRFTWAPVLRVAGAISWGGETLLLQVDNVRSVSLFSSSSSSDEAKGPFRRVCCALRGMDAVLAFVLIFRRLAGLGEAWNAGVFSFSACVAASRNAVSSNSSP